MAKPGDDSTRTLPPENDPSLIPTWVKWRFTALYVGFGALLAFAAFAAGLQSHDRVISQTRTHKVTVQEQLGTPSQSVDGAQINKALTGLVCDVYQAKAVVLCHR